MCQCLVDNWQESAHNLSCLEDEEEINETIMFFMQFSFYLSKLSYENDVLSLSGTLNFLAMWHLGLKTQK